METRKALPLSWVLIFFLTISLCGLKALSEEHHGKPREGPVVEKDQRRTLVVTEFGEITAIDVKEGSKGLPYYLQFIILEPNSLFLPVLLHADMVFYVHTGSGRLTWANDDGTNTIPLREGDVCSLNEGSVFYIQSNLEAARRKLRIYAMFTNTDDNTYDSSIGAYSRINELVKGFDKKIMQAALRVPEDLIEVIISKSNTPAIVHAVSEKKNIVEELEASFLRNFLGVGYNSKKLKTYNIFDHDPDFKNSNGWSTAVTKKQLKSLKRTNIGFLMVNLTMGSILGPHWNPKATELVVAVDGDGMVRVVCGSSNEDETECQNMRFKVKEGDAFVVPRFHPMAQMSFNDGPFVFLGFSTSAKKNHPQFLAGKGSVLHILDKRILATSLGVSNKTIDQLLRCPNDSIIFGCSSCAEEEEKIMKEEEEKRKREEEEERKKKEEEEKKKEEEEEERKKKEEEEKKKEEEEEERKKKEEEEKKKEEEEEERKKKEEERKREEEEEARKKEKERKREEEEAKRQQEERERKREEEEARREREEEKEQTEARRERERGREEERQREEEEARRQQEKREKKRERERKRAEEEARREQEREREKEVEREEEAARREQERKRKREEAAAKREQEKRERRRQEEEAKSEKEEEREKEEARRQQEEERGREEEEEKTEQEKERREEVEREEEEARREQERRRKREEAAAKREQEKRERRRQEEEAKREHERKGEEEEEQAGREPERRREKEEEAAQREQEQAEREQQKRERRRQKEEQREGEEEEEAAWRERGGRSREKGKSRGGEEWTEWEQEAARRQEEARERRRERESDDKDRERQVEEQSHNSFEGRKVLKIRNV